MDFFKFGYFAPNARKMLVPCSITIIGAALSLSWVLKLAPWWIGALGLLCDALDGYVARKLDQSTDFGSQLDWQVDMLLYACAMLRAYPPAEAVIAILALLPFQVGLRLAGVHFCGRALAFAALIGAELFR